MDRFYEALHVCVHVEEMGRDLCVTIAGGDQSHIGCVAIAEPRPSLIDDGSTSSTVSTYNFPGHKDNVVANRAAHALAARLKRRIVVLCGLHYTNVSEDLFLQVQTLTEQIIEELCSEFDTCPEHR